MRYQITNKGELHILEVIGHNIFFGWDMSSDYDSFRVALDAKGVDAFVDLLIEDSNNAFTKFVNG
jgi:DNA helicase HerA-like ATPase